MKLIDWCERGWVPDSLVRLGIRRLCAQRLLDESAGDEAAADGRFRQFMEELRHSPVAIETAAANQQHYELPTQFFQLCLGKRLKYSSCLYPRGDESLDEAEEAMLALYGERAGLADGQDVLELGCGWGSLTLWMAQRYPGSRIMAVSNSKGQREHIEATCRQRGIGNVRVMTGDVNHLELPHASFDRCVSVEMFEHMRNYQVLLGRISQWLRPGGKLFVHVFCHRTLMYPFQVAGDDNWMGKYFFTGGLMPAADTLLHFQESLALEQRWLVPGRHYQATANHWLANHDANASEVMAVMVETYGKDSARVWNQRWRMFWMACAELFGFQDGNQWMVAHYRFSRP